MSPRQVDHHGERHPAPEGISHARGDLWWPEHEQLSKDPDEVNCTQPMWWKFVQSTPSSYASSLAVMTWKDREGQTVDKSAGQLQQYKECLSSSLQACISAVEKLPENVKQYGLFTEWVRSYCGKASEVEGCHMESYKTRCRNCWRRRWIEPVCRKWKPFSWL